MEVDNGKALLAHIRPSREGQWEKHLLEEHLCEVAKLAGGFAGSFGGSEWASLAGLWHDLGKYQPVFQNYIRGASGYDAHIEIAPGKVDHSSAGAIHACDRFGSKGRVLAYLIAGHHAGLSDWHGGLADRLQNPAKRALLDAALAESIPTNIFDAKPPTSNPAKGTDPALWIRLLFSCVVDADFLDTESFMDEGKSAGRHGWPTLADLAPRFEAYMAAKTAGAEHSWVNRQRAAILARCLEQATQSPGLFSLTVPTGGGKTLSALAFALRHARVYNKRRIIYVIPYTSIIEQTAEVFRDIVGEAVLEHHSNLDSIHETPRSRLACENWHAPLIVTTAVRFFQSLFANRTSRVRKLHNIVDSVVVLDEAQLLPPDFLAPILGVIRQLKDHFGVSFALSTATQPALASREGFDWYFQGLDDVRELMEDTTELHWVFKRVWVEVPTDLATPGDWSEIVARLREHPSVLCIIDRRDDCRELHRLMPKGTLHVSGLMCGAHRAEVIKRIKAKLKAEEPVRVVSTQLVEAGVDVDFPVVFRALAGLDSVAQAAGRCNREGRLKEGRVVVFIAPRTTPSLLGPRHPDICAWPRTQDGRCYSRVCKTLWPRNQGKFVLRALAPQAVAHAQVFPDIRR